MQLHHDVLDVGRNRGSYGSLACPWPALLVALVLGLGALGLLVCSVSAWGATSALADDVSSEHSLAKGLQSFQRGDFEQAVVSWSEAARRAEKAHEPQVQSVALTHLAQAYQALGHYRQAVQSLEAALALAQRTADRAQSAAILGSLGNIYIATGPADKAEALLRDALRQAQDLRDAGLAARILHNLGNLLISQQKPQEALGIYREVAMSATQAGAPAVAASALTHAAMAAVQSGRPQEAMDLLHDAWEHMQPVPPSHDKAYALVNIGLAYNDLRTALTDSASALTVSASRAFNAAANVAQVINDPRAAAYAWGHLGHLYETVHRYQEALHLTQRAVLEAQQVYAPESLYQWHWQTGRLRHAMGDNDAAIAAYERAVDTLQSIRYELLSDYGKSRASFREALGPVYFELVDLLLQRAAAVQERDQSTTFLKKARDTVELFKAAELRDYFRDDCVDAARARTRPLEDVSQTAAIIYPILLPERTELLVSLPTGLKRVAVPVGHDALERVVRSFREAMQDGTPQRYLRHGQRLYDWLIRPLEPDLLALHIDTLVFVPDGPLRTIPMAALHDGVQFLISKYALATTPGLALTDPRPFPRDHTKALAMGLTTAAEGALPYVAQEVQGVGRLYGGTVLLNQAFRLSRMETALQHGQFSIVHIASHGHFAGDVAHSFLLTFDEKLTLERLAQVVGRIQFHTEPLEILTLSACDTAIGDDRAALGLAGVAIKAGARSALATLWRVQDEAAAVLVVEFYRQLHDASVSRAVALQRAQLHLMHDSRYQHPFFWAPFLLLNSWL
jgi:CHAT domain-containing protein